MPKMAGEHVSRNSLLSIVMRKLTHSLPDHWCTQTNRGLTWKTSIVFLIFNDIFSCIYLLIYIGSYILYFPLENGKSAKLCGQEGQWLIRMSKDLCIAYMCRCSVFLLFHSFLGKTCIIFYTNIWIQWLKMSVV